MHSLLYDVTSVIIYSMILASVFFVLFRMEKRIYLLYWCFSYVFFTLSFYNALSIELGQSTPFTRNISVIMELISGTLMLNGTYRFVFGRSVGRFGKAVVIAFFLLCILLMPIKSALPELIAVHVFVGLVQIFSGIMIVRHVKGIGGRLAGISLFVWGFHRLNFIITLFFPFLAVAGYQVTLSLILLTSLGIVLMYFERVKKELMRMDEIIKKVTINSRDIVFNLRLNSEYTLEYISPSVEAVLGYTSEELMNNGAHLRGMLHADKIEHAVAMRDENGVFNEELYTVRAKDGSTVKLEISSTIICGTDGKPDYIIGIARDITQRTRAFDMLSDRKQWYEEIFKHSNIMVLLVDCSDMSISDCNDSAARYYCRGYDELKSMKFQDLFVNSDELNVYINSIDEGFEFSCKHILPNGIHLYVTLYTSVLTLMDKKCYYITVFDGSSSVFLADELSRMRNLHKSILESINEGVVGINAGGEIFFINDFALSLLGYEQEEVLYKNHHNLIHCRSTNGEQEKDEEKCEILKALKSKKTLRKMIDYFTKKDGTLMPVKYNFSNLKESSDAGILIFRDISEELEKEKTILNSLDRNKLLMHELHHRIKNNFQIISSLLSIHADSMENEREQQFLLESVSKIHSLALIHEMLYHSDSFAFISTKTYFVSLIEDLKSVFHEERKKIVTFIDIDDVLMHIEEAVPCALIINELYTNSVKYAVNDENIIEINITFKHTGTERRIYFSDNGTGGVSAEEFDSADSYGLMIIQSLVKQLKGSIVIKYDNGLHAEIRYTQFTGHHAD